MFNIVGHPLNIQLILLTLEVFHFEISGKLDNDEHPLNIEYIMVTLSVFQLEISGIDEREEHPLN